MQSVLLWIRSNALIIIILLLGLFLRILWLDKFPIGMTNDELHFVLNSKSIYLWGTNLANNWNPFSLTPIPNEISSELTFLVILPFIGPLPLSMFNARFPFVIVGVITIFLIYLIVKRLINKPVALFSSLVFAINPWSIYVSRTAYDTPIALSFFLLALFMMISLKGWKILFCILPLTLAFYTYIGTKIIFPLFVLISIFYCFQYINNKKYLKQYLILSVMSFLLVVQYSVFILSHPSLSRTSEIEIFDTKNINDQVNDDRRSSIDTPFNDLFINKATIVLTDFTNKYIDNFSTNLLFVSGDNTQKITLWKMGYFYYLSFLFLIIGIINLPKKYPREFFLFLGIIIISPIPAAIRSDSVPSYAFHSALIYPILTIFIGFGLASTFLYFSKKPLKKISYIVLSALITLQLLNFVYIYFFRYPVYNSEAFNFSNREIIFYINQEVSLNRQVYIVASEPKAIFENYIFYNNLLDKQNINLLSQIYNGDDSKNINDGQIHFIRNLGTLTDLKNKTIIIQASTNNNLNTLTHLSVSQLSDAGEVFGIYNGVTCTDLVLKKYPSDFILNNFNLESLTPTEFCQKFITYLPKIN